MPTYEYQCIENDHRFEVKQSFKDDALTQCQIDGCSSEVRKVYSAAGIVFKGSGYYVTDTRAKNPASAPPSDSSSSSSSGETSSSSASDASSDSSSTSSTSTSTSSE